MKNFFSIFIIILCTLSTNCFAENSDIEVFINGEKIQFDQPPTIIEDRVLVPVRAIFEGFKAEVTWDSEKKEVIANKSGIELILPVNKKVIYKDGYEINLDISSRIINDRVLVPIRAIGESLKANVEWDSKERSVSISKLYSAPINRFGSDINKEAFEMFNMNLSELKEQYGEEQIVLKGEKENFYSFKKFGKDVLITVPYGKQNISSIILTPKGFYPNRNKLNINDIDTLKGEPLIKKYDEVTEQFYTNLNHCDYKFRFEYVKDGNILKIILKLG